MANGDPGDQMTGITKDMVGEIVQSFVDEGYKHVDAREVSSNNWTVSAYGPKG